MVGAWHTHLSLARECAEDRAHSFRCWNEMDASHLLETRGRVSPPANRGACIFRSDRRGRVGTHGRGAGLREARRVLYMATLTATRHNPAIKVLYERLKAAGKLPKVALVACMRKLLSTLSAMVRTGKPRDKSLHSD